MTKKLYCFKQVLISFTVKIMIFFFFSSIKHIMDRVDHSAGGRGYVNGTTDICIEER